MAKRNSPVERNRPPAFQIVKYGDRDRPTSANPPTQIRSHHRALASSVTDSGDHARAAGPPGRYPHIDAEAPAASRPGSVYSSSSSTSSSTYHGRHRRRKRPSSPSSSSRTGSPDSEHERYDKGKLKRRVKSSPSLKYQLVSHMKSELSKTTMKEIDYDVQGDRLRHAGDVRLELRHSRKAEKQRDDRSGSSDDRTGSDDITSMKDGNRQHWVEYIAEMLKLKRRDERSSKRRRRRTDQSRSVSRNKSTSPRSTRSRESPKKMTHQKKSRRTGLLPTPPPTSLVPMFDAPSQSMADVDCPIQMPEWMTWDGYRSTVTSSNGCGVGLLGDVPVAYEQPPSNRRTSPYARSSSLWSGVSHPLRSRDNVRRDFRGYQRSNDGVKYYDKRRRRLDGSRHDNTRSSCQRDDDSSVSSTRAARNPRQVEQLTGVLCKPCNVMVHSTMVSHLYSFEHKQREKTSRRGCLLCKTGSFPGYKEYQEHMDGDEHKKKKIQLDLEVAERRRSGRDDPDTVKDTSATSNKRPDTSHTVTTSGEPKHPPEDKLGKVVVVIDDREYGADSLNTDSLAILDDLADCDGKVDVCNVVPTMLTAVEQIEYANTYEKEQTKVDEDKMADPGEEPLPNEDKMADEFDSNLTYSSIKTLKSTRQRVQPTRMASSKARRSSSGSAHINGNRSRKSVIPTGSSGHVQGQDSMDQLVHCAATGHKLSRLDVTNDLDLLSWYSTARLSRLPLNTEETAHHSSSPTPPYELTSSANDDEDFSAAIGINCIVPTKGFFCLACRNFWLLRQHAVTHCSTEEHLQNYASYAQRKDAVAVAAAAAGVDEKSADDEILSSVTGSSKENFQFSNDYEIFGGE